MKSLNTLALEQAATQALKALPAGTKLWVAVSGGLDSVTLLHILARLWNRKKLTQLSGLGVIHVNHNLRGKESEGDAAFVRKLAKEVGLPLRETKLSWPRGKKIGQAEAREKREEFYAEVLTEEKGSFLATAHHLDDQAETVLLRILRGTGLRGLRAMQAISRHKIRPFLEIQHSQIQSSADELGLTWKEDSSNRETKYERNWLRKEILPRLEARRPGVAGRLASLAAEARSLREEEGSGIEKFSLRSGSLYRVHQLTPRKDLAKIFGLERAQAHALAKILAKGQGKFAAKGKSFWVSCGVLLLGDADFSVKMKRGEFESSLGIWKNHGLNFLAWSPGSGKKLKRELLEARVPEFLRASVPIVDGKLALPKVWEKKSKIRVGTCELEFQPAELAKFLFAKKETGRFPEKSVPSSFHQNSEKS